MPTHYDPGGADPNMMARLGALLERVLSPLGPEVETEQGTFPVQTGTPPLMGPGGPARGAMQAARAVRPHPNPARRAAERFTPERRANLDAVRAQEPGALSTGLTRLGGILGLSAIPEVGGRLQDRREERISAAPPRPQETRRTGRDFTFRDEELGELGRPGHQAQAILGLARRQEAGLPTFEFSRMASRREGDRSPMVNVNFGRSGTGVIPVPEANLISYLPDDLRELFVTGRGDRVTLEGQPQEVLNDIATLGVLKERYQVMLENAPGFTTLLERQIRETENSIRERLANREEEE